jgi:hypothetical protein
MMKAIGNIICCVFWGHHYMLCNKGDGEVIWVCSHCLHETSSILRRPSMGLLKKGDEIESISGQVGAH